MTDDIVAKLRGGFFLRNEAADEIERNRAAIAELVEAANELLSRGPSGHGRLILEADCMNLESIITKHTPNTNKEQEQ